MNTGRNALAIVGSEPLVTAGNVQHRRIELLVEGFGKGFTEPFQARCRRRILEGNHDHGPADHDAADHSSVGGGVVLGAKCRAEKQRNQKGENRGAFHDKLIISAQGCGDGHPREPARLPKPRAKPRGKSKGPSRAQPGLTPFRWLPRPTSAYTASSHLNGPGAAQFASPAFSPAFRSGHHFHFSFLVAAGGIPVESAAGGCGYRMAYPNRRADSNDALPSPHRSVFFHHARPALVCLGVVVRHSARRSASSLRTERSGLVVRLAGRREFRAAAFATAAARDRSAAGDRADVAGGGRLGDSSLRAPAHCELAFFSALVCCSGKLGRLGTTGAPRGPW